MVLPPKLNFMVLTAGVGFMSGVLYVVYRYLSENEETIEIGNEAEKNNSNNFKTLLDSLESDDENVVVEALQKLTELTAFKQFQVLIRECNGLEKIKLHLLSNSLNVKFQTLNVLNNLAMDAENQFLLQETIENLIDMLITNESADVMLGVTRVLTNMTTLSENHIFILPHLTTLCELLTIAEARIKLQILKILVNISTSQANTLQDMQQILNAITRFIDLNVDDEILLRAVTCFQNTLSTLTQKYHDDNEQCNFQSQIVPVNIKERLEDLKEHENEEIQIKTKEIFAVLDEFEFFSSNNSS